MTKILDRAGLGAAITAAENDANLSSLSGINEDQSGTTHTIDIDDQNKTITYSNAGAVTVTLTLLSTIAGALHTDDYRVILKSLGAGGVTINTNAADTFDDTTTSQTLAQYEVIEIQSSATATIWNVIRKRQLVVPATTNNLAMLDAAGEIADSLVESDGSGNITADVTGNLTGDVNGDITSTGTSSIDDLTVSTSLSIPASSIARTELNTTTTTAAGTITAGNSANIAMNAYAFFPMIHASSNNVKVVGHPTDGASADNPRFRLFNDSVSSETYDVDHRNIQA